MLNDFLRRLLGDAPVPASAPVPPSGELPPTVQPKVLAIIHNPVIRSRGGRKLHQAFGWNDPDVLAKGYADDIRECSYGIVDYQIVERIEVDGFPVKRDGFAYDEASYLRAFDARRFHEPDAVDYLRLVEEFDIIRNVESKAIDEVWLLGHPYAGYYESIMGGAGAFWCNAPPLAGTERCSRRFVIMGFNFERGVGEMLEDMGHRAESILTKVFESTRGEANLFERFTRYDLKYPGRAECGNVHFAPNSVRDYDWGNTRVVPSRCDTWYHFPDLSGQPRPVNCREWGDGDIRLHHRWWLSHFPHVTGSSGGISHNWWSYVIDPNLV